MRSSSSLVLTALLGAGLVSADVRGRVTVAPESTVEGATIRLADIARLEGDGVQALGALTLGAAPAAGESRFLEGSVVLQALGRELGSLDGVTYTIPARIRVRRAAQTVSEATVRGLVEAFLAEALGARAADAVVRTVELPGPIRLPAGAYRARVITPPGAPLVGRVRLQLEFAVDDRPVQTVWITAEIGLFGPVVLARRPIARGERLVATDLAIERRDLAEMPADVLGDPALAEQLTARTPIAAGAPVRREQLEVPPLVHRGDVVLLVAERGAVRITSPGEVRADAGPGEQVRVVNRVSRKEVLGRVLDARTVVVDF